MAELYNKPLYLLDVPCRSDERAVRYVASQLEQIAAALESQTGLSLSRERIEQTFSNVNEARSYQLEVNGLRKTDPTLLSGDEALGYVYLLFLGSGHQQTAEIWQTLAEELRKEKEAKSGEKEFGGEDSVRLIWLHLRPYHSSDLINYLERELEARIVMEEMNYVYWPPLNADKPFESLARKVLANPGLGPLERRLSSIEEMVSDYKADGVVHFSHWGCRQSVGGTLLLKKYLKKKQIPFLSLDGDCIDGSSFPWGQARTRVDSFYEILQH